MDAWNLTRHADTTFIDWITSPAEVTEHLLLSHLEWTAECQRHFILVTSKMGFRTMCTWWNSSSTSQYRDIVWHRRCLMENTSFLPSLFAQMWKVQHATLQCIMSRTARLNKALTAALYNECNTMTIDTQVINKTKYKIRQYKRYKRY